MDHQSLWHAVLTELRATQTKANYATWLAGTAILSSEDGHIVIAVRNKMTKDRLEDNFGGLITDTLTRYGTRVNSLAYAIDSAAVARQPPLPPLPDATATSAVTEAPEPAFTPTPLSAKPALSRHGQTSTPTGNTVTAPAAPARPAEAASSPRAISSRQTTAPMPAPAPASANLNPRYTFDTFVVGSSNELAYAAAQAVAREPGSKYNPLYLYGGVGLGKTHLMQAVGNEIRRRDPSKRVEYVTIESFTNEFIEAIQKKKNTSFTDKYRSVDVLIIDDMQFLAGKEKTQDEFFHTFNALHQANKQIIISSDKPPQLLTTLEERLRSRFSWGMTADVHTPDLETRQAILQNKAESQGIRLDPEVIDYLARHADHNIRELEGVLTQLLAFCELRGLEPNVTAASQLLAGQAASKPKAKPMSPKTVIERVADYFDVASSDIVGPKRDKEIVVPRQITMYLLRHDMSLSFPKIGSSIGGRDHTTAMHSVTKIEKALAADTDLREDIEAIREQLATVA